MPQGILLHASHNKNTLVQTGDEQRLHNTSEADEGACEMQ